MLFSTPPVVLRPLTTYAAASLDVGLPTIQPDLISVIILDTGCFNSDGRAFEFESPLSAARSHEEISNPTTINETTRIRLILTSFETGPASPDGGGYQKKGKISKTTTIYQFEVSRTLQPVRVQAVVKRAVVTIVYVLKFL